MAEYKEIADLEQAGVLNSGDQLPLQQQGAQEAKRTSVGALSAKVAADLDSGALRELATSVSLGKAALADALTNKGAASTPSDTLVQMADKVRNLVIDGEAERVLGPIAVSMTEEVLSGDLLPFTYVPMSGPYVMVQAGNKLYLIDRTKKYASVPAALAAAAATLDLVHTPVGKNVAWAGRSRDGKTFISHVQDSEKTLDIYNVDYDVPAITHVKSIKGVGSYGGDWKGAISNDRTLLAWCNGWGDFKLAKTDNLSIAASISAENGYNPTGFVFDEDNNTVYSVSGNGGKVLMRNVYTVTDTAITVQVTKLADVSESSSQSYGFFHPETLSYIRNSPLKPANVAPPANCLYTCVLSVRDLRTNTLADLTLKQAFNGSSGSNFYSPQSLEHIPGGGLFYLTETEPGKWRLELPGHGQRGIIYDAAAKTLSAQKDYAYAAYYNESSNNSSSRHAFLFATEDGYLAIPSPTSNMSSTSEYLNKVQKIPVTGIMYLGQKRTVNGSTTYYLPGAYPQAQIESGAFALDTQFVELTAAPIGEGGGSNKSPAAEGGE